MTTVQHKDIPNSQLHEPKNIITALNRQVYVANGATSGTWRKLTNLDMDYSTKANNVFGWNDISDSLYTSGSPRSIAATTRTQLTNNAAAPQTDVTRLGGIWDTTNNQFLINDLNATYMLRLNFKVKAAAAAGTPYVVKVELESNNGPTIIYAADYTIKGGSYENGISHTALHYMGSTINNAPLKIYVTADTPITLYQTGFVIQRTYKET